MDWKVYPEHAPELKKDYAVYMYFNAQPERKIIRFAQWIETNQGARWRVLDPNANDMQMTFTVMAFMELIAPE